MCRKIRADEWGRSLPGTTRDKLETLAASLIKVKPLDYSGKYNPAYRWKVVVDNVAGQGQRNMAEWVFRDAYPDFVAPPKTDRRRRDTADTGPAAAPTTVATAAPEDWECHTTETGRVYYTNKHTMHSVWTLPAPAAAPATAPPATAPPATAPPAVGFKRAATTVAASEEEWRKLRRVVRMLYDKVEAMKPPGIAP